MFLEGFDFAELWAVTSLRHACFDRMQRRIILIACQTKNQSNTINSSALKACISKFKPADSLSIPLKTQIGSERAVEMRENVTSTHKYFAYFISVGVKSQRSLHALPPTRDIKHNAA